ncbi:MAG: hypothetical protein MHM6MM_000807 [Cercozoa sp. M6MM]
MERVELREVKERRSRLPSEVHDAPFPVRRLTTEKKQTPPVARVAYQISSVPAPEPPSSTSSELPASVLRPKKKAGPPTPPKKASAPKATIPLESNESPPCSPFTKTLSLKVPPPPKPSRTSPPYAMHSRTLSEITNTLSSLTSSIKSLRTETAISRDIPMKQITFTAEDAEKAGLFIDPTRACTQTVQARLCVVLHRYAQNTSEDTKWAKGLLRWVQSKAGDCAVLRPALELLAPGFLYTADDMYTDEAPARLRQVMLSHSEIFDHAFEAPARNPLVADTNERGDLEAQDLSLRCMFAIMLLKEDHRTEKAAKRMSEFLSHTEVPPALAVKCLLPMVVSDSKARLHKGSKVERAARTAGGMLPSYRVFTPALLASFFLLLSKGTPSERVKGLEEITALILCSGAQGEHNIRAFTKLCGHGGWHRCLFSLLQTLRVEDLDKDTDTARVFALVINLACAIVADAVVSPSTVSLNKLSADVMLASVVAELRHLSRAEYETRYIAMRLLQSLARRLCVSAQSRLFPSTVSGAHDSVLDVVQVSLRFVLHCADWAADMTDSETIVASEELLTALAARADSDSSDCSSDDDKSVIDEEWRHALKKAMVHCVRGQILPCMHTFHKAEVRAYAHMLRETSQCRERCGIHWVPEYSCVRDGESSARYPYRHRALPADALLVETLIELMEALQLPLTQEEEDTLNGQTNRELSTKKSRQTLRVARTIYAQLRHTLSFMSLSSLMLQNEMI